MVGLKMLSYHAFVIINMNSIYSIKEKVYIYIYILVKGVIGRSYQSYIYAIDHSQQRKSNHGGAFRELNSRTLAP